MATNSDWTVVFEDKMIINHAVKNAEGHSLSYIINDDSFWNDAKWSNVWAIQYKMMIMIIMILLNTEMAQPMAHGLNLD